MTVGILAVSANVITFTPDFVRLNLKLLLPIPVFGIVLLMIGMLSELMPKSRGLRESLKEIRKDEFIDAGMRKLEKEPPMTWSQVAWCTQETMSVLAEQRHYMPWQRVVRFLLKIGTVILLLAVISKLLVLASTNGRFGLTTTSSFADHLSTSVLGLVTFGNGIVHINDFSEVSDRLIFHAGMALLTVMSLGLGINLLASSLDETTFINHLYSAVRTHFESLAETSDLLARQIGSRSKERK
jgi:uncharacterized membrane protein